ncbi:MAG: hypothetical protein AB7S41_11295 [Parvibaculaceae bacterium]
MTTPGIEIDEGEMSTATEEQVFNRNDVSTCECGFLDTGADSYAALQRHVIETGHEGRFWINRSGFLRRRAA